MISLKHKFTSAIPDAGDPTIVQPSNWNDEHALTQATSTILGRVTAGTGVTEELTPAQARTLLNVADGATANSTDAFLLARANHTGTESADVLTDGTTNKAFLATERTKLAGIATGATANQTDAFLLARANHTGTQLAATISDFAATSNGLITTALTPYSTTAQIAAAYQPLAAALTSWAGVTRASGFDTFAATPSSANLLALMTTKTGTANNVFSDSPALTGTPTAPTAAVDTNTTQLATTAMVIGQAAAATPLGNLPTAAVGTSTRFARADHVHPGREVLTANRTYYVLTTGSDSNTGLVNTAGGAFLTIQKALNVVLGTLDLAGFNVTIQCGNGTYAAAISFASAQVGAGNITINGDTTTPSNVTVGAIIVDGAGCRLFISGLNVDKVSGQYCLSATNGGYIKTVTNNQFSSTSAGHRMIAQKGGVIDAVAPEIVAGTCAGSHYRADMASTIYCQGATWTASGTATQGNFAGAANGGVIYAFANTSSGTFVGVRYTASTNGVIQSNGGGASYFPGSSVGTTTTGGQYA